MYDNLANTTFKENRNVAFKVERTFVRNCIDVHCLNNCLRS